MTSSIRRVLAASTVAAPREAIFDLIAKPYLGRPHARCGTWTSASGGAGESLGSLAATVSSERVDSGESKDQPGR